jgi:O-antigen/teichoic acid export membrane protein
VARSTFAGDTALYGAAVMLDRLLGFLLLPLLTRAISAADYGAWTQTGISAGLLLPVVLFGLPTAVVRFFSASAGAAASRRMFFVLAGMTLVLWLLCAAPAGLMAQSFAQWVYGEPGRAPLVLPMLGLLAADAGSEYALAWLRAAGRIGVVSAVLVLRSTVRYGVVLIAVRGGDAAIAQWLGWYAVAQCVLAAGTLAVAASVLRRSAAPAMPVPAPTLRELLAFAAPLAMLAVFTVLNSYVDRYVLVQTLGLRAVAVYAAALSLCTIPAVFYSVLGFTLFPALARHWAEQRREEAARLVGQALRVFLFLCVPVATLLALVGPWLLPRLTTEAYAASPIVFALLGVAVACFGVYQILLYLLLLDGRSHHVLVLAVVATAFNLALNLVLAPRFGAAGAAAASALSNTVMAVLAGRLARRAAVWRFPWAGLWTIAWRSVVAVLPWVVLPASTSWAAAAAALLFGAGLYLGLDWWQPRSVMRSLLSR